MALEFDLDKAYDLFAAGVLSVLGGTSAYIYRSIKEDTGFSFKNFFVNAFLSFFIGNLVGSFIPASMQYRDGLLMLAGFATWPILGILEFYGRRAIAKFFDQKLGLDVADQAIADLKEAEDKIYERKKEAEEKSDSEENGDDSK